MRYAGNYSYANKETRLFSYSYELDDDEVATIIFRLSPVNINVASLEFVTSSRQVVDIPRGFELYSHGDKILSHSGKEFFITWVDDYKLYHDGNLIFCLSNNKQQSYSMRDAVTEIPHEVQG